MVLSNGHCRMQVLPHKCRVPRRCSANSCRQLLAFSVRFSGRANLPKHICMQVSRWGAVHMDFALPASATMLLLGLDWHCTPCFHPTPKQLLFRSNMLVTLQSGNIYRQQVTHNTAAELPRAVLWQHT